MKQLVSQPQKIEEEIVSKHRNGLHLPGARDKSMHTASGKLLPGLEPANHLMADAQLRNFPVELHSTNFTWVTT